MSDVAELGLKIDSSQAATAAKALDNLSASGKKAEDALSGVEKAAKLGGPATQGYTKALGDAYGVTGDLSKAQVGVIRNLEDQISRTRLSGSALAQYNALRKAGTTAETEAGKVIAELAGHQYDLAHAGENAGDKLSEQRVKFRALSEAAGIANGQLGGLVSRYGQLTIGSQHLTPGIIAGTLAIGALVAAATKAISVFRELATTSDISSRTGVGVANLTSLSVGAGNSGMDPAKFEEAMLGFSHAVDEANHGMGTLSVLLRANQISAQGTEDAFYKIADLVKNAGSDATKFAILQQAGLPATRDMAKYLEQGSVALRAQAAANGSIGQTFANQAAISRQFDELWNKVWTSFTYYGKAAILGIFSYFKNDAAGFVGALADPTGKNPQFDAARKAIEEQRAKAAADAAGTSGSGTSGPLKITIDPELQKRQLGLDAQALSAWGELATVQQKVSATTKSLTAAAIDNNRITKDQIDAVAELTRIQAEGAQVQTRVTLGVSNAEELRKQKFNDLQILIKNGTINVEQAAVAQKAYERTIRDTTDAMEVMKSALPGLKQLELDSGRLDKQLDTFATGSLNNVTTALADVTMGTASAGDAFRNLGQVVVRALEEMIIKMTIIQPLAKGLQSSLGGFNFFGGSGGGADLSNPSTFVGPLPSANGNVFMGGIGGYSNQVVNKPTMFAFANGTGLMGEAGPEAIMPLSRGADGKLGIRGSGEGGGVTNNFYQDFRGVDPSMKAWILTQIRASQRQTLQAAPGATAKVSGNNPNLFRQ